MAVNVADLIATLRADTSQFQSGMQNANASLLGFGAASVATGNLVSILVTKLVSAAVSAASFSSTVVESSSKIVESMDFMAQRTGVSLQAFQELQPVFARNGVSVEQLGGVFRILSMKMEEANDHSSKAAQALDRLGLSFTGLEPSSEVLTLIAERLSKMPAGFEKSRIQTELLGRQAGALNAVLNEGAAGFRKSADEAHKMGNVLNNEANAALLRVNDTFDDMNTKSENLSKHLAVFFSPFIEQVNLARNAFTDWSVGIVDQATVASRTIAERLSGIWSAMKNPSNFEALNAATTQSIANIRELGVTAKDTAKSVGTIDTKAQAVARSSAKATEAFFFGLTQVDMGWKIVQESINAYGRSQEALGQYLTTGFIEAFNDLHEAAVLYASKDLESSSRSIEQYKAMESQIRSTAAASNQAALAGGQITPIQFAERSGALAIESIDQEIRSQQQLLTAKEAYYETALQLALGDATKQRELIQQNLADATTINNSLLLLQEQRRTQGIANATAEMQAKQSMQSTSLAASSSMASSELQIAQAQHADNSVLRSLRLQEIEIGAQRELAIAGLTQEQITAIHRKADAERAGMINQFPTVFESAMQNVVNSSSFSMGTIVNQFSGAMADWMMGISSFQNFWKNAMRSLAQAFINEALKNMAKAALASGIGKMFGTFTMAMVGGMSVEGASGAAEAASRGAANPSLYGPGFASGGEFTVPGAGGTDTVPINFMATPGETVSIRTPSQHGGGGSDTINIAITVNAGKGGGTDSSNGAAPNFEQLAQSLSQLVERKIIDEQRPGGLLSGMA